MNPMLDVPAVNAALEGTPWAGGLHHLPSAGSTNALALAAAQAGTRSGVWVADEQTAGRGRGGHTWHSPPGDGLYVSALVRPQLPSPLALHLSLATGLAAQSAIALVTGVDADLRWPNDLIAAGRKCGGILVESATGPVPDGEGPARLRYAVIGVGINVGHAEFPPELAHEATSLRREGARLIAREPLLIALLGALDRELAAIEHEAAQASRISETGAQESLPLLERFAAKSSWVRGKRVVVEDRYTGTTAGLTAEGFLLVAGDDGGLHTVRSGGVRSLERETTSPRQPT